MLATGGLMAMEGDDRDGPHSPKSAPMALGSPHSQILEGALDEAMGPPPGLSSMSPDGLEFAIPTICLQPGQPFRGQGPDGTVLTDAAY